MDLMQPGNLELSLLDITGRVVFHFNLGYHTEGEFVKSLSLAELASGMYFIQIKHNEKIITEELRIKK